jgi:Tfp pilus assembly protein PilF
MSSAPANESANALLLLIKQGFTAIDARRLDEAEQLFRRALDGAPQVAQAWLGLGNTLVLSERPGEAVEAFRRAVALKPDYPEARANLGMALDLSGQHEAAVAELSALTAAYPDSFPAAVNHAVAARKLGLWSDALRSFERAAELKPEDTRLRYECALLRLGLGDYPRGWTEYEHRWVGNDMTVPLLPNVPEWRGEPLAGKTVLILPEQGFGDTLQFIRYAPLLKARGARVLFAAPPPLTRLLAAMPGLDHVADNGRNLPAFDYQTMLMSLPLRFGTTLATVPADVPYLQADPALVRDWRTRLGDRPGLKVGLVWAGGPHRDEAVGAAVDRRRSLDLARFKPLADIPGVRLISLQKGQAEAEARLPPDGMAIENPMDSVEDFADTAALIFQLDLVITVDTAVAHLAGALGKPVWVLSRLDGCWRWLDQGDGSPWYPTLRLFRQRRRDDWDPVIEELRDALAAKARPGLRPRRA